MKILVSQIFFSHFFDLFWFILNLIEPCKWALTYGPVMPYGIRDLRQHWFRQWLVAWQHQAITRTNVDLSSVTSDDIHLSIISLEMSQPWMTQISLKITDKEFLSNLPGASELTGSSHLVSIVVSTLLHWAIDVMYPSHSPHLAIPILQSPFDSLHPTFSFDSPHPTVPTWQSPSCCPQLVAPIMWSPFGSVRFVCRWLDAVVQQESAGGWGLLI